MIPNTSGSRTTDTWPEQMQLIRWTGADWEQMAQDCDVYRSLGEPVERHVANIRSDLVNCRLSFTGVDGGIPVVNMIR